MPSTQSATPAARVDLADHAATDQFFIGRALDYADELVPQRPLEARVAENPTRVVWALAWPAVALNSLQVINTLLDRFFIGHLEPAALTAQGASQNVMFLMFSLAMALGTASTALVSRAFGAEDVPGYRIGARQCQRSALHCGNCLVGLAGISQSHRPTGPDGTLVVGKQRVIRRQR